MGSLPFEGEPRTLCLRDPAPNVMAFGKQQITGDSRECAAYFPLMTVSGQRDANGCMFEYVAVGLQSSLPDCLGTGVTVKARIWLVLYRVVLALFLLSIVFEPALVEAEGFGPFPVRNFQPIQQLVLNMPGDRAAVLKQGVLDVRVGTCRNRHSVSR